MERYWFICGLLGWFCAKEPDITSLDLRIKIDDFYIIQSLHHLELKMEIYDY